MTVSLIEWPCPYSSPSLLPEASCVSSYGRDGDFMPRKLDVMTWTDLEAEVIVDELTSYDGANDLRVLQTAIAQALFRFYEMGRAARCPDEYTD
jgi:hypothetical protein